MSKYNKFTIQVEYPDGYRTKWQSLKDADLTPEDVATHLEQKAAQIREGIKHAKGETDARPHA